MTSLSVVELPDDLWRQILERGIKLSNFNHRNLCSLSIVCRRLHRLSDEDSLWSSLLLSSSSDTSSSSSSSSAKSIYKIRYEREREKMRLAHKLLVLRKQGQVADIFKRTRDLKSRFIDETHKLELTVTELAYLRRVRQASIALNVWQPEVVRSRQKQVVQQCAVPVDSRIHALQMENKLCDKLLTGLDNSLREEKRKLKTAKEELALMNYQPLQGHMLSNTDGVETKIKRKKLKISSNSHVMENHGNMQISSRVLLNVISSKDEILLLIKAHIDTMSILVPNHTGAGRNDLESLFANYIISIPSWLDSIDFNDEKVEDGELDNGHSKKSGKGKFVLRAGNSLLYDICEKYVYCHNDTHRNPVDEFQSGAKGLEGY
ncbi:hypothetical protein ACFE04_005747 [Oxalis oulophora]